LIKASARALAQRRHRAAGAGAESPRVGSPAVAVPAIAYLCSEYPAVSHTFVLREVDALRRLGVQLETFSIRRTGAEKLLARADRIAAETTVAILPPRWPRLLGAHLALARRGPATYLATLGAAIRMAPLGLRSSLWQCFYFIESVLLWNECRKRGIRHIHVHFANAAADLAMLASRIGTGLEPARPWSWSLTLHGPTELYDVRYYRLVEKLADARFVVCISDYARSQAMALSDPRRWGCLRVIHVGIPAAQFTRKETGESPQPTDAGARSVEAAPDCADATVLCVGRLVPEKGQTVLLEALATLLQRGFRVALTLAGEGPSRLALEELAQRLGIASQVTFLGAVGQEEIGTLYESAAIFCLPSFAEGVPVVLMEAMAMQVPVVSTHITGIPELIEDGRTGLLVSPGRPDRLADALERLLRSPELGRELVDRARAKVLSEFDTQNSARLLCALFAEQLSQVVPTVANGGA
jgi:colanic acid/amylovoran biosynthesis glycosyltransferase